MVDRYILMVVCIPSIYLYLKGVNAVFNLFLCFGYS